MTPPKVKTVVLLCCPSTQTAIVKNIFFLNASLKKYFGAIFKMGHLVYTYQAPPTSLLVQVEDVKLSRKVLYYFAFDSIVNEVLILENR